MTPPLRTMTTGLALLAALFHAPRAVAAPQEEPPAETEELKRLEAWPEVDDDAVSFEIERLRKARTPEMGEQATAALIEIGAGAAPKLLARFGREKDEDATERMLEILDTVTGAPHTRLLAEFFDDKQLRTRTWSLQRVAQYPDAGVKGAAEAAFTAADKRKRDRDDEEVWSAAVCAASSGSLIGFDVITADSKTNWKEHGEITHVALTALRGPEATKRVAPLLEGDRKQKVAGLRLLAACGDKETATPLVRPILDTTDNSLLVGAINALRGIVDGDPPLGKLPTFEAIERAKKWKSRL